MTIYDGHEGKFRVCCSCRHRILKDITTRDNEFIFSLDTCEIDGHYIGYADCFDCWCRHWSEYKIPDDERSE